MKLKLQPRLVCEVSTRLAMTTDKADSVHGYKRLEGSYGGCLLNLIFLVGRKLSHCAWACWVRTHREWFTKLLDCSVCAPGQLQGHVNPPPLVLGPAVCLQWDTRAGSLGDDGNVLWLRKEISVSNKSKIKSQFPKKKPRFTSITKHGSGMVSLLLMRQREAAKVWLSVSEFEMLMNFPEWKEGVLLYFSTTLCTNKDLPSQRKGFPFLTLSLQKEKGRDTDLLQ